MGANPKISGKINIIGDFIIDVPTTFENATVKINPGVGIIMEDGQFISLSIDNSKLFACFQLWKGIRVGSGNTVMTYLSEIEDAEKTIDASDKSYVTLDVVVTTFNRNRNNLYIANSYNISHTPYVKRFSGNKFTCTSPLNGTSKDITETGVLIDRCPLFLKSNKKKLILSG
jgi:hypothetical protein